MTARCVRGPMTPGTDQVGPQLSSTTWCGKAIDKVDTYSLPIPAELPDGRPDPAYPSGWKPDPRLAWVKAGHRAADAGDRFAEPATHVAPHLNLDAAVASGEKVCPACFKALAGVLT